MQNLEKVIKKEKLLFKAPNSTFYYGTAGYRSLSTNLINVFQRSALTAYLKANMNPRHKIIGVMITASHNKYDQNGLKFIDFKGKMFDKKWEGFSDDIVNCKYEELIEICRNILKNKHENPVKIGVGFDTRSSNYSLFKTIKNVLLKINSKNEIKCYGIVSTPQLHYLIKKSGKKNKFISKRTYYRRICNAYNKLISTFSIEQPEILVDTANGSAVELIQNLNKLLNNKFKIINKPGEINLDCGSDLLMKEVSN